jgi:hypothetical protein
MIFSIYVYSHKLESITVIQSDISEVDVGKSTAFCSVEQSNKLRLGTFLTGWHEISAVVRGSVADE